MFLSKERFARLWLISAGVVVIIRFFHGAEIGYDLTLQLQAAQNLVAGHGLSIYSLDGEPNLATPNPLIALTYFPAGYSLCAAVLLVLGCTPAVAAKLLAVAGTLLGWWGWGRLAYAFMREGIARAASWRYIAVVIAIATPLLFTPRWTGTDLFLWAALPWVLLFITRAADPATPHRARFDLMAGALAGFAVVMRYESLLLAAYTALLIVCQSVRQLGLLTRRLATFVAGMAPFISVQLYLNYFASTVAVTPGGVNLSQPTAALTPAVWNGFLHLTTANVSLAWWLPEPVIDFLTQTGQQAPWLLALTAALFVSIPVLFATKLGHRHITAAAGDPRSAATGLFIAFPLFLWACALGGAFYVGIWRYYVPLIPLAVLSAYAFSTVDGPNENPIRRIARSITIAYLAAYVGLVSLSLVFVAVPGEIGAGRRARLLGVIRPEHRISVRPNYEFSPARRYVLELLKQRPDTILVANQPNWFYAEPGIDRSRLHRVERMKSRYVTGPAHLLILTADLSPEPETSVYQVALGGKLVTVPYFESIPDLRLVRRFPDEKLKVLEAEIPEGTKFELKRTAPAR